MRFIWGRGPKEDAGHYSPFHTIPFPVEEGFGDRQGGEEVVLVGSELGFKVKGFKPFTAEEVKKLRAKKLAPQQVLEERKKLGLK